MPTSSVIVPVYKVEAYIHRCVDSILNQTFRDIEVILVDDGSPDACGAICDEYARKDCRVRVIHKENGGLSSARNAGIDAAQGEWLTFVDSDDYIHERLLEALFAGVKEIQTAVCMCNYIMTNGEPLPQSEEWKAVSCDPETLYLKDSRWATVAWAKLYQKECFDDLRYPLGRIHEDEFVTYKILFRQKTIAVINAAGYGYFRNNEGITRAAWTPKRLDEIVAYEEKFRWFTERGYTAIVKQQYAYCLWNICTQIEELQRCMQEEPDTKGNSNICICRKHLRRMLHRCRKFTGQSARHYMNALTIAYPTMTKTYFCGMRMIRKLLGDTTIDKLKEKLGR